MLIWNIIYIVENDRDICDSFSLPYFKFYNSAPENISIQGKLKFVHTDILT